MDVLINLISIVIFIIHMYQIITLYTLFLHSVIHQLYLNKAEGREWGGGNEHKFHSSVPSEMDSETYNVGQRAKVVPEPTMFAPSGKSWLITAFSLLCKKDFTRSNGLTTSLATCPSSTLSFRQENTNPPEKPHHWAHRPEHSPDIVLLHLDFVVVVYFP